jgi:methionine-S-sulfoxide reductase
MVIKENNMSEKIEKIVLGGGCFWCLDPIFSQLNGVSKVLVGYAGGNVASPSYEQICTGKTGHAEVIEITFEPDQLSLNNLLEIFFQFHDPTTLNRQGADVGTQFRSIVLASDEGQLEAVQKFVEELDKSKNWRNPIVTQVELLTDFFPAEEYHQNYFEKNPWAGYCQVVINPKVKKFKEKFAAQMKK